MKIIGRITDCNRRSYSLVGIPATFPTRIQFCISPSYGSFLFAIPIFSYITPFFPFIANLCKDVGDEKTTVCAKKTII